MTISPLSLIYIFGALQALMLVAGINFKQPLASSAKIITSVLLLVMFMVMSYYVLLLNEVYIFHPYLHSLGGAAWMAISPAYYLMLKSIREPKWELNWASLAYFFLPMLFLGELLLALAGFPAAFYRLIDNDLLYLDCWMACFFVSGFYFLVKTLLEQRRVSHQPRDKTLQWFNYAFLGIITVFFFIYIGVRRAYLPWFEMTLMALCAVFVFSLVFKVFQSMSFRQFFEQPKYDNREWPVSKLQQLAQQLEQAVTENELYRKKELNLNELAQQSGINANTLSQLFGLHYKMNFYDFINRYRLEQVEQMMLDPANQQYKIIALAEASGFKSKTTFYKVFKEKHQMTPAQFMKRNLTHSS